jgi:hypothetical protein
MTLPTHIILGLVIGKVIGNYPKLNLKGPILYASYQEFIFAIFFIEYLFYYLI